MNPILPKYAIYLSGNELLSTKEIAKQLAFLPQDSISPEDSTVREVVALGRYPYQGIFQKTISTVRIQLFNN